MSSSARSETLVTTEHVQSRRVLGILVCGVLGFVVVFVGCLLGHVTIAPLLLLGAPAMFVALALGISSPALIAIVGFVLYASYGTLITWPLKPGRRWIPFVVVILFNLGSMFALSLAPLLFGEGL